MYFMLHAFSRGEVVMIDFYKERPKNSHKGDFGRLAVLAYEYTGAPALVAMAALRSGTDLVEIIAPKEKADIIASFSPNLIVRPTNFSLSAIKKEIERADAFCVGSGLGKNKKVLGIVKKFLLETKKPGVVDADALVVVNKNMNGKSFVLTPHRKEFELFDKLSKSIEKNKKIVTKVAKRLGLVVLLKGPIDIISDGKNVELNKTGNPYMTKGGTGDVLTGIVGSLLAQGLNPFRAACLGAYISGLAGDRVAKEKGPGLLATDIIEKIPEIIK